MKKTKTKETSKKQKTGKKLSNDERVVDLLERIGSVFLYTNTSLNQNEVGKAVGIGVHHVNELVKSINKESPKV